jgi:tetratricopeptide (TPR) repeat protein
LASSDDPAAVEVAFLRASLVDLDAELAAGDLSPADHRRLADEYTARLAAALRAQRGTPDPAIPDAAAHQGSGPGRGRARRLAVAGGVALFAVAAGLGVARLSGTRTSNDTITGSIEGAVRGRLDTCLELSNVGSALEALRCYDDVLAQEPSSVEALTYRGWTLVRVGDDRLMASAEENLQAAVRIDPAYADARVFRAVLYLRTGRPADAQAELDVFDSLNPPLAMRELVEGFQLRPRIAEALAVTPDPTSTTGGS